MEDSQRKKTIIIKGYEDGELAEIMSQLLVPDIPTHKQYCEISDKIEEIYQEFPKIQTILDRKIPEALSKEEVEAILRCCLWSVIFMMLSKRPYW